MEPLSLVGLTALMERTTGHPDVKIGVIDGPVLTDHPDLAREHVHAIPGTNGACQRTDSAACLHGTFVTGILAAKRDSPAPAICPGCTLLIRPIFAEALSRSDPVLNTTAHELADAMLECILAGVRVINLSLAVAERSAEGDRRLAQALDQAVRRGVIVVAAAGNEGTLGSSVMTRHPWVIPVVACDARGRPLDNSNLGRSIGRLGLTAPGDGITSLGPDGRPLTLGGTSVAVPFVTGAIGLLLSALPGATAADVRLAVTQASTVRRSSVVPPLLDASAAYDLLSMRL